MEYTFEQLQQMSDEEISELNKRLGIKVMKRWALFMIVKWALIFGAIHAIKKFVETVENENRTKNM